MAWTQEQDVVQDLAPNFSRNFTGPMKTIIHVAANLRRIDHLRMSILDSWRFE